MVLEIDHRLELASRMEQVHRTLRHVVARLDELRIPYAIVGSLAMAEHGYQRATTAVDLLLTRSGLDELKAAVRGLGFVDKFPGSRSLRDTSTHVPIDFLLTGDFPGDGRPKAIAFPDPALAAKQGRLGMVLPLESLIELKLASGLSAPERLKDLADVLELIRAASLSSGLSARLHESVRAKYDELWHAAQGRREE